jgi:ferredoxin
MARACAQRPEAGIMEAEIFEPDPGGLPVPYVIAEPCISVKDKSCVAVCPVDCIHEADDQLYIDPSECIDCGLCEPECPVDAIFMEDEVPDQWKKFIQINKDYSSK